MRVLSSIVIIDSVVVAACVAGYLLLVPAIKSHTGPVARSSAFPSEQRRDRLPARDHAGPAATIRSPADRIRDAFEQLPGSQRPAVKPSNRRGDLIMFC
jgi:hypothetical protein